MFSSSPSFSFSVSAIVTMLAVLGVSMSAGAVADPPPCSLNGRLTNGTCVCIKNSGWVGETCNTLLLQPAAPLTAENQTYFHPRNSGGGGGGGWVDNSWGISVLPDDTGRLWHGFMTELAGNCSLSSYTASSRILHLTAPTPTGPWAVEGVALSSFAHNPQAVRDIDGAWLLFHIGNALPGCNITCPGGQTPHFNTSCYGHQGTSVARALSPYGPWQRVEFILPDNQTNPSALVLANGTIVVTARRWEGGVPIYTAPSWRGPYTMLPLAPVIPVPVSGGSGGGGLDALVAFDEDPYLYINELGTFHMLTHRQPNGTNCPATGVDSSDCRCAGGHMYATDLQGPWYYDLALVFNCTLSVVNEASPVLLHARQRPTMLFPPSTNPLSLRRRPLAVQADHLAPADNEKMPARQHGAGGGAASVPRCPILFTGASTDKVSQYYSSFTMAQEVACD